MLGRRAERLLLSSALIVTLACYDSSGPSPHARIDSLSAVVGSLESMQDWLSEEFVEVRSGIDSLKFSSAELDLVAGAYSRVDSRAGQFLISVEEIRRLRTGSMATLLVGNLTSARFNGGVLLLTWGTPAPSEETGGAERIDWWMSLKNRSHRFTEELRPGAWTPIEVALPQIAPDSLGYLRVGIRTDRLSLIERPQ